MSPTTPTRSRVLFATALTFGGAFVFVVSLAWPLVRLAIPGPLYYLTEAICAAIVALLAGLLGCALAGDFHRRVEGFIGLSLGGALMLSGGAALSALVLAKPANILSRGAAIAGAMALSGYTLAKVLGRNSPKVSNVT